MHLRTAGVYLFIVWAIFIGSASVRAQDLAVVSVQPSPRSLTAPVDSPIVVQFDRSVIPSSLISNRTFWAFGRWSGTATGSFSFADSDRRVTLTPDKPFSAGEQVMVILSHDIEAVDGSFLRQAGYSFQFWTKTLSSPREFSQVQLLNVRTNQLQTTRAYGGIASDLNGDRYLDITIVNEDTADLRVFLNRANFSGTFHDFALPTFSVGARASPNEPTDFNRDGITDICVANIDVNSVSILLGNGDGTFASQQLITVGNQPRGIAVLDADGDGDIDIVNTNFSSNNMSLLLNDGTGVFSVPTFFDAGGNGEWALAAADMTEDGLLDLVVGSRSAGKIFVLAGVGAGVFSPTFVQDSGGSSWMLVCGDVDGDTHEDVAVVNSQTNNAAILFGGGNGTLSAPQIYVTDPFSLATDLGDLDGDGDLDWITSSFSGDWFMFDNPGNGSFTFAQSFPAAQSASCALLADFDNDGDLDIGLIDELADTVAIMSNSGSSIVPAVSTWGLVALACCVLVLGARFIKRVKRVPTS